MISVIIPYHNEGVEFITITINSIKDTIDVEEYEIIIVDDASKQPLRLEIEGVRVLTHAINKGVGEAFDTGVAESKYDRLFLMGSDIRFNKNQWCSKMITEIDKNPKSLIASTCVAISFDDLDFNEKRNRRYGSNMLLFHDQKTHPKMAPSFRNILEAQWRLFDGKNKVDTYQIPCILGAAYGVNKAWYNHIDGFSGHRSWGTLEPYISLKSWMFGGDCLVAPSIETAHIFKIKGTHGTPASHLSYNKMFVSLVLFDEKDADRLITYLGVNQQMNTAKSDIAANSEFIEKKRALYQPKIKMSLKEFCDKWDAEYRDEERKNDLSDEYDYIYSGEHRHYSKSYEKSPYLKVWEKVYSYVDSTDKVLDIGCGPGQVMDMFLDKGVKEYIGYDFSKVAVEKAEKLINERNATVRCVDLYKVKEIENADIYVSVEVFEHLTEDKKVLSLVPESKRVVLTVPNYLGGSHVRKFDTEEEVLERYGSMIDVIEISTIIYGTGKIFVLYGKRNNNGCI